MPPCINTSEFLHAAMRPDVLTETVVEVSTEDSEPMEVVTVFQEPEMLETEPSKRRKCENTRMIPNVLFRCFFVCEGYIGCLKFFFFFLNKLNLLKLLFVRFIILAGRKPKPHHISNGSPDLGIKKKSREGKGTSYTFSVICV